MLVNALRAIVKMEVSLIQDRSSLLQSGFIQIQGPLHVHSSFKLGCKQMAFHVCVKQKGWNSGYIHVYWMNFGIFTQCGLTSRQYSCTVTQVFMPYWNFDDEKWEVAWAKVLQLQVIHL